MTQNQEPMPQPHDPALMDWTGQQPPPPRPATTFRPPPADNPPPPSAEPPDWVRHVV